MHAALLPRGPILRLRRNPGGCFQLADIIERFSVPLVGEPGIDVTTGPAMIVRAYLESYTVGQDTFDAENVYPGSIARHPNEPREGEIPSSN